jgi:hypothetical protein
MSSDGDGYGVDFLVFSFLFSDSLRSNFSNWDSNFKSYDYNDSFVIDYFCKDSLFY